MNQLEINGLVLIAVGLAGLLVMGLSKLRVAVLAYLFPILTLIGIFCVVIGMVKGV